MLRETYGFASSGGKTDGDSSFTRCERFHAFVNAVSLVVSKRERRLKTTQKLGTKKRAWQVYGRSHSESQELGRLKEHVTKGM